MNGAIFYASKHGNTARYAGWIGEATGLPVFDIENAPPPESFDFFVVGSPVIYYGLLIEKWVSEHLDTLAERPVVFFSVSGVGAGRQLDEWISESLPGCFVEHADHVALMGPQGPTEMTWGAAATGGEMDRDSIAPVVEKVRSLLARAAA